MNSFYRSPSRQARWILAAAAGASLVTLAGMACLSLAAVSAPVPLSKDVGAVRAAFQMSAIVWLKSSHSTISDGVVSDLYDQRSINYHRWIDDENMAGFFPSEQDVAAARASLVAQGLSVDKVFDRGAMVRVSGSVAAFEAAFGTSIDMTQAGAQIFPKAVTPMNYQGAHAELVGGVSGLVGSGMKPLVARQLDLGTGLALAAFLPKAGVDPLAAFTTHCFGTPTTVHISGFAAAVGGVSSLLHGKFTGRTYLQAATATATAAAAARPICGYTAQQLAQHYGLTSAYARGWRGGGQTIVIVDAYGSPTARADLNTFSQAMGLPKVDSESFQVMYSDGVPTTSDRHWALETSLDIEWVHAIAPDAKIVLVLAPTDDSGELAYAVDYAVNHRLGHVISNGWGLAEARADASTAQMFNQVFERAAARGVAVNVATGDGGDNGVGSPVGAANVPSDSQFATAVGGTSIGIPGDNGPVEAAWGLSVTQLGNIGKPLPAPRVLGFLRGGGGGESTFLAKPAFQDSLSGAGRQTPDIAAVGDPQTGAIVVETDPDTGMPSYVVVGGTSLATPIFSAFWALADQASGESLGQAAPVIAALPTNALKDVLPIPASLLSTNGSITFQATTTTYAPAQLLGIKQARPAAFLGALVDIGVKPIVGYNVAGFGLDSSLAATPGWDNATGYGVPDGLQFIVASQQFSRYFRRGVSRRARTLETDTPMPS